MAKNSIMSCCIKIVDEIAWYITQTYHSISFTGLQHRYFGYLIMYEFNAQANGLVKICDETVLNMLKKL